MKDKTLTTRIEEELDKELEKLAKESMERKSALVRKALIDFVEEREEEEKVKDLLSEKYVKDEISFEELVRVLGYEEAKKLAFFKDIAKRSLVEGLE